MASASAGVAAGDAKVNAKNNTKSLLGSNVWVFEISWEVARQIGGIHTVIKSKAAISTEELGDNYCLIGPLIESQTWSEIEVIEAEQKSNIQYALHCLRNSGYRVVVYGRWLIEGYPKVILMDISTAMKELEEFKKEIWDEANIGIPWNDTGAADAVVFGFMTALLLEKFCKDLPEDHSVVAQFHEWMAGVGLIVSRARKLKVATIFSTHATVLGRHLCASRVDFYNNISKFSLNKEAGDRNIYQRYCIERASAHVAHVFTTISDILSFEVEHLLAKKPDLVLPNGLNVKSDFVHEIQNRHSNAKQKLHNFVRGHFYGHFNFDLEKTLYFFSAGRNEFSNKGVDMFIESLARLNHRLKISNSDMTVVAFLIFPTECNNFNVESLRGQAVSMQLKEVVNQMQKDIGKRILDSSHCSNLFRGHVPDIDTLLTEKDIVQLKRCIMSAQRKTLPPICTHNVTNDVSDPILCALRSCRLFNDTSDRVKVIFHPEFLHSNNPLFGLDYEDFASGCHLGVFPSYYEPWGYTPAECTIMGVPSITTNLSGFGCFIQQHTTDPAAYGVYIVDRRYKSVEESIEQLTGYMMDFCQQTRRQRIIQRNRTERLSELLDWKHLSIVRNFISQCLFLTFHNTKHL
ncbi:hypothetical protein HELRODRAFT_64031 [Helobdella robusta]|uniref:Glycogen [starch] synthase n=1 Tax=Helobdella robusta TaxID=6412 RepID=T1FXN5_HELRO|nr:hypothetical protein HELRODRAFT_64031 [Helobdella robusta]ESO06263.1 hypothetical protein HELRODRAFT_64031 [Helobdella robusta]